MDNVKNTQKPFPNINVDVSFSKCISVTLDPTVTFLQSRSFSTHLSAYTYALGFSNSLDISHPHSSDITTNQKSHKPQYDMDSLW